MKYTAQQIRKWDVDASSPTYGYIPARSINHKYESLFSRVKNAFGVLTGKYDVLDWQERESKGGVW